MDLEKALDRVPRKVLEWSLWKKGIPEVLARSVMSLYVLERQWSRKKCYVMKRNSNISWRQGECW